MECERIEIPTPFSIGRVNCYALAGEEFALIDPGPVTEDAYRTLTDRLAESGHGIADVDRVLVTHPHMDHSGLARRIAEESGAEILAHADAAERLADPDGHLEREQSYFRPFFRSMGVPPETVEAAIGLPEPYTDYRDPVTVDRKLEDGDRIDCGVELEAVHTPGHAPGSVCFVADGENAVFTGDHVMMDVSPNPLLTLAPGEEAERTRSLPDYMESLREIRRVGDAVGYAGHRGRIPDVEERASEILEHHRDRKGRIAEMLREGPTTAYRIMQEMFPDLPVVEVFPGMSEVIGHLDLLEDDGTVETVRRDDVVRYELSS